MNRRQFFNGQKPTENEFNAVQDNMEIATTAVAQAIGCGIVRGLEVTTNDDKANVAAGAAIDAFGRLIRLEDQSIDLAHETEQKLILSYALRTVETATDFDGQTVNYKQVDSHVLAWADDADTSGGVVLFPAGERVYVQENAITQLPVVACADDDEIPTTSGRKSLANLYEFFRRKLRSQIMPVGTTYMQLPNQAAPSELFDGTWAKIEGLEGCFFRNEGGNSLPFEAGKQEDLIKAHNHTGGISEDGEHDHTLDLNGGGSDSKWRAIRGHGIPVNHKTSSDGLHSHDLTIDNTGGVETRPSNLTVIIWVRTA